ncbi:MAG: low-specificity L-threonine aldolase [Spirochaetia bacterium]
MKKVVDLRSDTVTKPTKEMREVISVAPVGDDVYGEDPCVYELEQYAMQLTGKEAAIFVTSGTMGNLLALLTSVKRGEEVIMDAGAHIYHYELSGISAIVGAKPVVIHTAQGIFNEQDLAKVHHPCNSYMEERTGLIAIENTHNFAGGTVWSESDLESVKCFAKAHRLPIHIDGARVFNASVASGMSVKKIASYGETITFCLSKGLGAPVGSVLCGTKQHIADARRWRKMLGGGMRQCGILAAAGLYALKNHIELIKNDHAHAQKLAQATQHASHIFESGAQAQTNILFVQTKVEAKEIAARLEAAGVRCLATAHKTIRFVTHMDVDAQDIEYACEAIRTLN